MGNICSTTESVAKVKEKGPRELIAEFSISLLARDYPFEQCQILHSFCQLLLAKCVSIEACERTLLYFSRIADKKDGYQLLNTALLIATQTEQIFFLNQHSLAFFSALYKKNQVAFAQVTAQIKELCTVDKALLKAHHLDTVVASLQQQIPANALNVIDLFLIKSEIDYEAALQTLRQAHAPELDSAAKANNKIHHAIPHALEIRERALYVLSELLGLFPADKERNLFLKAIIGFMIEFHDHEQMVCAPFNSVEEVTAYRIMDWLTEALRLDNHPQLKNILSFMADKIIVLGTTMVFSPVRTVDLSEIYLSFADLVVPNELKVISPFLDLLEITMLITGVCDKNPAALYQVVCWQQKDANTATLTQLQNCLPTPLLIERFFKCAAFKPYFSDEAAVDVMDAQAFFITLAPHLCMRAEICAKDKPAKVAAFISFVADCRQQYSDVDRATFSIWYNQQVLDRGMEPIIDELLFNAVEQETSFSLSQRGGLQFVCEHLKKRQLIPLCGADEMPLIDRAVARRNANNLSAFKQFYTGLKDHEKQVLIGEVILAIVLQAGALYAQQMRKGRHQAPASQAVSSRGLVNHTLFAQALEPEATEEKGAMTHSL
jgi:hypothetical protein